MAILGFGGDFGRILEIFGGDFGKMTYICSVKLMIAIAMCILTAKCGIVFDSERLVAVWLIGLHSNWVYGLLCGL